MARYWERVEVDAWQVVKCPDDYFDNYLPGDEDGPWPTWANRRVKYTASGKLAVETPDATFYADAGDWIVKDSDGDMFLCDAGWFLENYLPVEGDK